MKLISLVVYLGFTLLDLVGPLQVMNSMCKRRNEHSVVVVSRDGGAPVLLNR